MAAAARAEQQQRDAQAQMKIQRDQLESEHRTQRAKELAATASASAVELKRMLERSAELITAAHFEQALGMLTDARIRTQPYLALQPVPSEISGISYELNWNYESVARIVAARAAAAKLPAQMAAIKAANDQGFYIDAADRCDGLLKSISGLASYSRVVGVDLVAAKRAALGLQHVVAPKAQRQLAAIARREADERAARARVTALAERCGRAPDQLSWNGKSFAVEHYLKEIAHDPGSVDVVECSKAVLTDRCWETKCRYRARNGFGALVSSVGTFRVATSLETPSGRVVGSDD